LLASFLVFGQFIDLGIDLRQVLSLQRQLRQPRFKVDGDRCAIFLGLLHVVDVDVVAEHGAGVAVFRRYRRARKGHKRGVGQRIAQVLGIPYLIRRCRLRSDQCLRIIGTGSGQVLGRFDRLQFGFKAVLRAVCFIGDHDDVVAVGEHREAVFIFTGHELLDGGEDDAAGGPVAQFVAQVLPGSGLHRLIAQQVLRQREDAEQLAVQIIAVGDDDDGWVLHRRVLHHLCGKAGHGDALAAALGMPNDAAPSFCFLVAIGTGSSHDAIDRGTHRMELVIAGDLLHQCAVILKQDEEAQVVEQVGRGQHATDQGFQFVELAERVKCLAIDGAPLHEPLGVAGERTQSRLAAVGYDQHFVVLEYVGYLFLVGLKLVVGFPDVGILVGGVF